MSAGLTLHKDRSVIRLESTGEYVAVTEKILETYLAQNGVLHLPEMVYQAMWDAAPRSQAPEEITAAQKRGQAILLDFLNDHYPDYHLGGFIDLSTKEAQAIHPKLTWGLWFLLTPKKVNHQNQLLPPPFELQDLKLLCHAK